jgi:hypothetical protein
MPLALARNLNLNEAQSRSLDAANPVAWMKRSGIQVY